MKRIYLQLIIALLCAACTHSPINNIDMQPQTILIPDTLWRPTGDVKLDSLLQLAAVVPQDTNLALLYLSIGDIYRNIDFEKAKDYYLKLGALSERLDWSQGRYWSAGAFANVLQRERLTDSAVTVLRKALELAKREENESQIANMLSNIGSAYFFKGWYQMALSYYMEAIPIYEKRDMQKTLQTTYYYLSQLYGNINVMDKAIEYGEKSVAINNENIYALCALACAYSSASKYEKANSYFEEALRLSTMQNNTYMAGQIYYFFADNALKVFDLEKAEKYANQSLEYNRQLSRASCCVNFTQLSKIEMLKGHYAQSEAYAKEALEIAIEHEMLTKKRYCYVLLAELAVVQGRYRENVQFWNEWDLVDEEIASETVINASEEMAAKYETEKKQLEIERQQSMIAQQNKQRWLLMGGIAVCVVFLVLLWYMLRLRSHRNNALSERNNALSDMNATKDKFFNIISHDLKNPAVALNDALKTLVKNGRIWDTETLTAYYDDLLNSSESHVELITHLLNWAKAQTGRFACTPVKCFLSDQLQSDVKQVREMAAQKGVTLSNTIPDDVTMKADVNILSTVVRNLLTNAVKFTPTGGTVTLSAAPVTGETLKGFENKFIISVTDTGIGMTAEEISNLFRLDVARSHPGTAGERGAGLGLIVCKELLEKHASALHVESETGKGSTFSFEI